MATRVLRGMGFRAYMRWRTNQLQYCGDGHQLRDIPVTPAIKAHRNAWLDRWWQDNVEDANGHHYFKGTRSHTSARRARAQPAQQAAVAADAAAGASAVAGSASAGRAAAPPPVSPPLRPGRGRRPTRGRSGGRNRRRDPLYDIKICDTCSIFPNEYGGSVLSHSADPLLFPPPNPPPSLTRLWIMPRDTQAAENIMLRVRAVQLDASKLGV